MRITVGLLSPSSIGEMGKVGWYAASGGEGRLNLGEFQMKPFEPDLIFFEPEALNYPLGEELYRRYKDSGIPLEIL